MQGDVTPPSCSRARIDTYVLIVDMRRRRNVTVKFQRFTELHEYFRGLDVHRLLRWETAIANPHLRESFGLRRLHMRTGDGLV